MPPPGMIDEVVIDDRTGETRKMGCLPMPASGPKLAWPVFGDTHGSPDLIPRDQWFEVDYSHLASPIKDQDGKSACNAFSSVTVLEMERRAAGLEDVVLSPGDLYYRINGGSDNGSMLEDALAELIRGVATAKTVNPLAVYKRDVNVAAAEAERPLYRILEAWWCPTFDHAFSAALRGYRLNTGIYWYSSDPLDGDGWLAASGGGRPGGHAIAGTGTRGRMKGGKTQWGVQFHNSWGPRWGRNGVGVIPEERASRGTGTFGWWALRSAVVPSNDPNLPPSPTLKP